MTDEITKTCGTDAGFGRGTKGQHVGTFIVKTMKKTCEVLKISQV
jgi:hypothetical protein